MHVVFHPLSSPVLVQAYMNPVAILTLKVHHQLTDNVAESHKQGTTILLYNGWLDPVSSEFWADQLSLTLYRGSTPSVGPTIRVLSPPSC